MKALFCLLLVACATDVDQDDAIYATSSKPRVMCSLGVDGYDIPLKKLEAGMKRAARKDQTLMLHAHRPGMEHRATINPKRIDDILTAAEDIGLPTVTFPEVPAGAGLMLSFDDASVDDWFALRDIFAAHDAHVTFFVSNYGELTADQKTKLHALSDEGHAIEAHGMYHLDAAAYVDEHGLDSYLAKEIDPEIAAMRADGFDPTTFAYPYGSRTAQLDAALLKRFRLLRSLTYLDKSVFSTAPCPY